MRSLELRIYKSLLYYFIFHIILFVSLSVLHLFDNAVWIDQSPTNHTITIYYYSQDRIFIGVLSETGSLSTNVFRSSCK